MKAGNILITILLAGLTEMGSLAASDSDTSTIFYRINEKNCLANLRLAIQRSTPEPVAPFKKSEEIAEYLKKNREALQLLYQAADMPRIDFACYNEAVKPEIIPVVSQTPRCIRLLMCDFSYHVSIGRGVEGKRALITALRMVQLTSGIPYLYGPLLLCSNIRIIFDGVRTIDSKLWHTLFSKQDSQLILTLLNTLEKNLTSGYQMAFRREGNLKRNYIEEYLRPRMKTSAKMEMVVSKYRNVYALLEKSFFSQSSKEWGNIMNAAEAVNQELTEPVVTPREWRQRYLAGMQELKELRDIFQQLLGEPAPEKL